MGVTLGLGVPQSHFEKYTKMSRSRTESRQKVITIMYKTVSSYICENIAQPENTSGNLKLLFVFFLYRKSRVTTKKRRMRADTV